MRLGFSSVDQKAYSSAVVCAGERAPCLHLGDHVAPRHLHRAAAGDPTDDDPAQELPAAECGAAGHAGAAASVRSGQAR